MPTIPRKFAAFPAIFLHDKPGGKKINQLIWGDYVGITGAENAGWLPVRVRNQQTGWVKSGDVQDERLLEIVFVDIGQGDGALVITPEDKFIVVDAGQADNMARFLRWRFRNKEPIEFEYGVMSHSDMDHYGGFQQLFDTPNFKFKTVCTNGLMERAGGAKNDLLGPRVDR